MKPASDPDRRVLLAVFAHPDDESFGPGGTLAKYAAEGAEVWLVCATDGDAGTVDASLLTGYASTGQLRAAELCCAAQALGLAGVDWLGYRDSGMAGSVENAHPDSLFQAPLDEVAGKIVASIRRHRPQVIICDNQFGGYGHPDHIKLHQATVAAFAAATDPARYPESGQCHQADRLFHPAFSAGWLKPLVRLMPLFGRDPRKFGRNRDIDLLQMLSWESPAHVRVDVEALSGDQAGGIGLPPEPGRTHGDVPVATATADAAAAGERELHAGLPDAAAGRAKERRIIPPKSINYTLSEHHFACIRI